MSACLSPRQDGERDREREGGGGDLFSWSCRNSISSVVVVEETIPLEGLSPGILGFSVRSLGGCF